MLSSLAFFFGINLVVHEVGTTSGVTPGGRSRTRRTLRFLGRFRVYFQKAGHSGKETGERKTESQEIQKFGGET